MLLQISLEIKTNLFPSTKLQGYEGTCVLFNTDNVEDCGW